MMMKDPRSREDTELIQNLGETLAAEKATTNLTKIPDDFYERASGHLRTLLAELENCNPEQGRTPDELYYRLSERLRRGRQILEQIYSTRERKIALLALVHSRGIGSSSEERKKNVNMLADEEDLFYSLKVDLGTARDRLLKYDSATRKQQTMPARSGIDMSTDDFLEEGQRELERSVQRRPMMRTTPAMGELVKGKVAQGSQAPVPPPPAPLPHETVATERQERCPGTPSGARVVKALRDIEPFVLPDGTSITLRKDDIASVPEAVANLLREGGLIALLGEVT